MPKPFEVKRVTGIKTDINLKMGMRMDDGEIRIIDFKKNIIGTHAVFDVLNDPDIFMQAEAHGSGVRWESVDVDIEVAELYDNSEPFTLFDP